MLIVVLWQRDDWLLVIIHQLLVILNIMPSLAIIMISFTRDVNDPSELSGLNDIDTLYVHFHI